MSVEEPERFDCWIARNGPAEFTNVVMMLHTQQHEVVEIGFTALTPELDVMGVERSLPVTPREATPAVSLFGTA